MYQTAFSNRYLAKRHDINALSEEE